MLLLDQLPRMIFRNTPKSYSGDKRAQELVSHGLKLERDLALTPLQRTFIYLVLEHTESLTAQDEAIRRFAALVPLLPATNRDYFKQTLVLREKASRSDRAISALSASQSGIGKNVDNGGSGVFERPRVEILALPQTLRLA